MKHARRKWSEFKSQTKHMMRLYFAALRKHHGDDARDFTYSAKFWRRENRLSLKHHGVHAISLKF